MANASPVTRARENLTGIVSVLVTGVWLAGAVTGQSWWLPFMLVAYVVVVPIVEMLFGEDESIEDWRDEGQRGRSGEMEPTDALATIRDRYARGELTEEQFERKLEQLLETETLEDVKGRQSIDASETDDRNTSSPTTVDEGEESSTRNVATDQNC